MGQGGRRQIHDAQPCAAPDVWLRRRAWRKPRCDGLKQTFNLLELSAKLGPIRIIQIEAWVAVAEVSFCKVLTERGEGSGEARVSLSEFTAQFREVMCLRQRPAQADEFCFENLFQNFRQFAAAERIAQLFTRGHVQNLQVRFRQVKPVGWIVAVSLPGQAALLP